MDYWKSEAIPSGDNARVRYVKRVLDYFTKLNKASKALVEYHEARRDSRQAEINTLNRQIDALIAALKA